MTTIDVTAWAKRNCWPLPSGELAVRPGLRRLMDVSGSGRIIAPGSFTVRDEATGGQVWHYLLCPFDDSQTARTPRLFIQDENFTTMFSMDININRIPRIMTSAVVGDQILINGPDFPPLFALVGGGAVLASAVDSDDETLSVIDPPSGICTSWVGSRVVIGRGRFINVSDPITAEGGDVRTYAARNTILVPGIVYGIHETGDGMLVVVTDVGVYGLDASAASVGIIGEGEADWRLLSHRTVGNYGTSCAVDGQIYALTKRGFARVDAGDADEVICNEPMMSMGIGAGRYALDDFRQARILAGDDGPIVAVDSLGAVLMTDLTQDPPFLSWWKTTDFAASAPNYGQSSFTGILRDIDTTPMYAGLHGVYRLEGDFDGTQLLSSFSTHHTGSVRGRIPVPPVMNPNPLHIAVGAALGCTDSVNGPKVRCALRGSLETQVPDVDQNGLTIGTSSWGDDDVRYVVTPMTSVTFDYDDYPTNDVTIEVGADSGLVRLDTAVDVNMAKSARERPQNKPG